MYTDDDFMETGGLVYLGDGWYKSLITDEVKYMTEDGDLITEAEYQQLPDNDEEEYDR